MNGLDLSQWEGDFGLNGDSDADGDGDSDGQDFLVWQRELGTPALHAAAGSVPEPASAALLLCGVAAARSLGLGRRNRGGCV